MVVIDKCRDNLFSQFVFENLRNAHPQEKKGVYIIRVVNKGKSIREIKDIEERRCC